MKKINQLNQEEFYLVVKDNKFFIEWLDNDEKHTIFPLFEPEDYEGEMQLAKKLYYPKSARFPLRHFTDDERAIILTSESYHFPGQKTTWSSSDDQIMQWMNEVLILDPYDFRRRSKMGTLSKPLMILEGCFLHNNL